MRGETRMDGGPNLLFHHRRIDGRTNLIVGAHLPVDCLHVGNVETPRSGGPNPVVADIFRDADENNALSDFPYAKEAGAGPFVAHRSHSRRKG
jgi:hypothetical protein